MTILTLAALAAGSGMAATVYTTSLSWNGALTSGTTSAEASQFNHQNLGSGASLTAGTYGTFATANGTATTILNGSSQLVTLQSSDLVITPPTGGSDAVLLWLAANQTGSSSEVSDALTISLTDINGNTTTYTYTTSASSAGFWGFTSGAPIQTISIAGSSGYSADLMDFFAGAYPATTGGSGTSTTSECATILFAGGGLILLGARAAKA